MSTGISRDVWSDFDLYCPENHYGGFKEGRILAAYDAERALSDEFTGDWVGSTFRFTIADHDSRIRGQLGSQTDCYWTLPLAVRMTSRANRAALGLWYTVFAGPLIDAQPVHPLAWDVTIGDAVSAGMLADRLQLPWRLVRDGFLDQLDAVSDRLDRDQAEPIIYGTHSQIVGASPSGDAEGYRIAPIYLGIETVQGTQYHVWMIAGHACKEVIAIYLDDIVRTESHGWLIPGQPNWNAIFGTSYVDKMSSTYGVNRRYTLLYGAVDASPWSVHTLATPSRAAVGDRTLTVAVSGVEDVGDGTGDLIVDRFAQYKHFLINYVANQGTESYQSGEWLSNPVYDLYDVAVEVVEEATFDTAASIAAERFGQTPFFGYDGAAVIGLKPGDRSSARKWIADWNRSCGCRFGINHFGQMRVVMFHPTESARTSARLYTDAYEILRGSFGTQVDWPSRVTSVPYRTDYEHTSGNFLTTGVVTNDEAIERYGKDTHSEVRDYPFAPGVEQAEHMALMELRRRLHPPRRIGFDVDVGEVPVDGDSLAYRDIGEYIKYIHYDAVTEERQERLAQIERHQVKAGQRKVYVQAVDCEDLIGFDEEGSPGWTPWAEGSPGSPGSSP